MRSLLAATTAAIAALTLAACGDDGSPEAGSPQSNRDRAQDGALKFAECMRGHGIDMPDPQVSEEGGIRIGPGEGEQVPRFNPEDPKFQQAEKDCGKHLRAGLPKLSPEKQAEMRDAGLKYAQCMRDNGVDMPDPDANGGFLIRRGAPGDEGGPTGPDPESPAFKEADRKCSKHLARVRPGGDGGPGVDSAGGAE